MTLLRILFAFLVFVCVALFGFIALFFKLLASLFGSKPKAFPSSGPEKSANGSNPTPSSSSKKPANNEVIEVEVISVRKEDDLK